MSEAVASAFLSAETATLAAEIAAAVLIVFVLIHALFRGGQPQPHSYATLAPGDGSPSKAEPSAGVEEVDTAGLLQQPVATDQPAGGGEGRRCCGLQTRHRVVAFCLLANLVCCERRPRCSLCPPFP